MISLNIKNNKLFEIDRMFNECDILCDQTKERLGKAETMYMRAIWNII